MKKLLIGLLVIVVLIVGGLFALPFFIPSETVKAELIAQIEAATGRDVRIDGPVSISVLPSASLSAHGIGLAGVAGDSEAFSADSVSFGLSLVPLLSGNVVINAVTFERPHFLVAFDKTGGSNWTGPAAPQANPQSIEGLIEAAPPATDSAGAAVTAVESLTVGRVSIVDGTVTYRDASSGTAETIDGLNFDVRMPRMIGAGTAEGTFAWRGHTQKIALTVSDRPAAQLLERIPIELTLSSDGGSLTAKGTALDGGSLFAGTMEASGSSLRGFLQGFGADLPDAPAFAKFSLAGPLAVDDTSVLIEKFKGDVGGISVDGGMRLVYDRERPGIGLNLAAGSIDAAAFIPTEPASQSTGDAGGIDLSALNALDANVDFSAREVALGGASLANLGMDVKLAKGVLSATVRSVEINGAPGSAALTIDAGEAAPVIDGSAKMNGLDLAALTALAGASAPVAGTAGLDVKFRTSGASLDQLLANLEASGAVSLTNGAVSGLGLAEMVGGDAAADRIDDVDLKASFASLSSPVSIDGALTWRGERVTVTATADARALAEGEDTQLSLDATSARLNVAFAGIASRKGFGTGKVTLSTPSLRQLLGWVGQPIGAGGGLEAFSLDGIVALDKGSFTFDKTAFTLDKSSGLGTGKIDFGGKPKVTAGLSMTVLDVTPYLIASGAATAKGGGSGGSGNGGGAGDTPIDFSGLAAVDADLNLEADSILADKVKIGPSSLTVKLSGGKLDADLSQMALYSGTGTGTVSVDGAAATPSVTASFRLANVSALPFLTDAVGFKRVEGVGSFAFDLKAAGKSQVALTKSLSGQGTMNVQDGAIRGIDIPKMLQSLSVNTLLGWQPSNDKTQFNRIDASFAITDGILTNKDLVIAGPAFALNGAGQIDIPSQTVSYRVNAQVAAGKKGQLQDFPVPVRIEGPLNSPKIYPEIQGVLNDPKGALQQLENGLLGNAGDNNPDKKKSKKKDTQAPQVDQLLNLTKKKP